MKKINTFIVGVFLGTICLLFPSAAFALSFNYSPHEREDYSQAVTRVAKIQDRALEAHELLAFSVIR